MQQRTGAKPPPKVQPKQIGSKLGLVDPAHPFAGVTGTTPPKTPPRRTGAPFIPGRSATPNLTEQVALARARKQRLAQGGLLSPAQRKAEQMASAIVETKTRFAIPPPGRTLAPPAPPAPRATPPATHPVQRVNPRTQMQRAQPGQGGLDLGGLLARAKGPALGATLAGGLLGKAYTAADTGFATGLEAGVQPFRTLLDAMHGGLHVTASHTGSMSSPSTSIEKLKPTTSAELAARISQAGLKSPDIQLSVKDLRFLDPSTQAAYAKGGANAKIPFADLANQTGWSLAPAYKAKLVKAARDVQGWSAADIDGNSATDLIFKAYNKPPNLATRILKGVAGDVVVGGSQTVGALGLASEIAQGRGLQAARDLYQQGANLVPGLGKHPWTDEALTHPLFALTALHAGLKSGGMVGHVLPRVPGERVVALHGTRNAAGEPVTVNRGPRDRNLYTAVQNAGSDFRARHTPGGAAALSRKVIDEHVRLQRDALAKEHMPGQVAYKQSTYNVKDKRATQIMAWTDFGGRPGLENGIAHFEAEARNGNPAAPRMLEHLRETLAHPPSGANELAFEQALKGISEHTSTARQNEGLHGAAAQLFRKYETPIEMAASVGDPLAITAKAARDNLETLQNRGPQDATPAAKAKITEVGRDVGRHTKKAAATAKTIAAQKAKLDAWKQTDKEIRARRPVLEKPAAAKIEAQGAGPTTKIGTFATRKDALNATIAEVKLRRKTNPKATASVKENADGKWEAHVSAPLAPAANLPKAPKGESTMAKHRAAVAQWKAELAAHTAKKPKVTGVARAGGRIAAHTTEVAQQGRRLEHLTEKQRDALPYDEQVALAKNDLDHSINDFIQSHHAAGGAEPARIARSKPPSGVSHPSRLAGKHRFTTKTMRGYRSTGTSVTRGEFVYDTRSPLHENAEIQRIRQHVGIWNELTKNPLVQHMVGDGEAVVPEGHVATPVDNLRSSAKTVPPWDSQTPVSMHDVQREHGIRAKVAEHLGGRSAVAGEIIPRGQEVFVMPKAMHDRIIEWAKPRSRDGKIAAYERANAAYQRILIGIYPSTWLGNAPGSIPLAIASGAIPGRGTYKLAARSGPTTGPVSRLTGFEKDPGIAPASIGGQGPAGSSMGPAGNPLMRFVGKGREFSMKGEDFSARAAWFGQAKPVVEGWLPRTRKLFPAVDKLMPKRFKGLASTLNKDATEVYHALASGKWGDGTRISPELDVVRNRMIDHVQEFMSATAKPHGELNRAIGSVVLFHNWLGHILKLTLVSLPLNHPRRALLLDAVSLYGNQYRQENGVYPSWMLQFLPLMRQAQALGGGKSAPGMLSVGLGQLTPISSASNLGQAGTQIDTASPLNLAAGLTSPLIQPFIKAAIAMHDNSKLHPGEPGRIDPRLVVLEGFKSAIPGYRKFAPSSGSDLAGQRRHYYEYVANPSNKSYKRYEIPYAMRPGGRPQAGLLGDASRVVGLPLEWSPTGGIPLKVEQGNQATIQSVNEVKRALKK